MKGLAKALYQFLIPVIILGLMILVLGDFLVSNTIAYPLDSDTVFSEDFREMHFPGDGLKKLFSLAEKWEEDPYEVIAAAMVENGYTFHGTADKLSHLRFGQVSMGIQARNAPAFRKVRAAYEAVLSDIACFPVPYEKGENKERVAYEDSWGDLRNYGGDRMHEGTDLMDREKRRGELPVVSMTDGTVTKLGWLELGGWRVGVTSPSGCYFYYAHLDSFAPGLEVGSPVHAGELLGFMGDTGYSTVVGTTGNFDVHLHLGIYLYPGTQEEVSVNPYWILKYMEERRYYFWGGGE